MGHASRDVLLGDRQPKPAALAHTDMTGIDDGSNPYDPPVHPVDSPPGRERGCRYWRWATHCLLGLFLGTASAALQNEPWNQPIHWINVALALIVFPAYFVACAALGHGLRGISLAICLVLLSYSLAFNALTYLLHHSIDGDFIATPFFVLVIYLVLFTGAGLLLRVVQRLIDRSQADAD
jgi:uncharacterized membrane protein YhaH (DUF805 family)